MTRPSPAAVAVSNFEPRSDNFRIVGNKEAILLIAPERVDDTSPENRPRGYFVVRSLAPGCGHNAVTRAFLWASGRYLLPKG